jgi:hypothetical protein
MKSSGSRTVAILAAFLSLSTVASAAALPAGFAPGTLWLSKAALADGERANVSTALYDSGDASLSGDLIFTDNGTTFANVPFTLAAGESRIYSAAWTAKGGSHTLGAALANVKSGSASASVKDASAASISVSVAAPEPPSPALSAATSTAGAVQKAASTAFDAAESVRTAGADAIRGQLAALSATSSASGMPEQKVLGTSTQKAAAASGDWLAAAERGALTGLLFVFDSQLWFYLLALIALYLVYKVIRTAFSDRRNRYR